MIKMDCAEVRDLLQPYADDELPPDEARAIAAHLGDCPKCAEALAELEVLRKRVRRAGTYSPPSGFERRLRALIFADRSSSSRRPWQRVVALSASHVVAASLGGLLAVALMSQIDSQERMVHDVVSAHVRSLLSDQAVQVATADPHIIRPWFGGKVTYAPQVKDLAGDGFPLLGARVDYVSQRAVAAIVYGKRRHRITLFVLPNEHSAPGSVSETSRHGFNVVAWRDATFSYYAASDLNRTELEQFAALMQSAEPK